MKHLVLSALLLLPGCASLTGFLEHAQHDLGAVKPYVKQLLESYDAQANARIEECAQTDWPSAEDRTKCLGPYAPDSDLSKTVAKLRGLYDQGANSLDDLLKAAELAEALADKAKKGDN